MSHESGRELTVLRLLTGTLSARDIARELCLSPNTIHGLVKLIVRKLGVPSREEAVARARRRGIF